FIRVDLGIQPSAAPSHRSGAEVEQHRLVLGFRVFQHLIDVMPPADLHVSSTGGITWPSPREAGRRDFGLRLVGDVASAWLLIRGAGWQGWPPRCDGGTRRVGEARPREGCPFCSVAEKGTRFPADIVEEGQLRVGRSVAVPNLFSKMAFDAVAIVDPARHVLFPSQIAPEALADAIRLSSELVRRARARDAALVHHLSGMNFLGPGGSSLPHPHLQVHVRSVPYSGVSR